MAEGYRQEVAELHEGSAGAGPHGKKASKASDVKVCLSVHVCYKQGRGGYTRTPLILVLVARKPQVCLN